MTTPTEEPGARSPFLGASGSHSTVSYSPAAWGLFLAHTSAIPHATIRNPLTWDPEDLTEAWLS